MQKSLREQKLRAIATGSLIAFAMSVICSFGIADVLLSITATILFLFIQYILKKPVYSSNTFSKNL